jgi:ABC-type glycerol-3-phosphate transport system permease component
MEWFSLRNVVDVDQRCLYRASRPRVFAGTSRFEEPTGSIAAASVVVTIPVVIMVVLFQRRIVAVLTSGAVKG